MSKYEQPVKMITVIFSLIDVLIISMLSFSRSLHAVTDQFLFIFNVECRKTTALFPTAEPEPFRKLVLALRHFVQVTTTNVVPETFCQIKSKMYIEANFSHNNSIQLQSRSTSCLGFTLP